MADRLFLQGNVLEPRRSTAYVKGARSGNPGVIALTGAPANNSIDLAQWFGQAMTDGTIDMSALPTAADDTAAAAAGVGIGGLYRDSVSPNELRVRLT